MAKRKTPKVQNLRPETITKDELGKLQNVVRTINDAQKQIGVIEMQKHSILRDISQLQDMVAEIQKEFKEKYGEFDVNIMDGTMKMTTKLIRKITIGKDYKIDAMHYAVGQEVYGGHTICDIIEEEDKYSIYIRKDKNVIPWKDFNKNMAISIEYNLEY